MEYSSSHLSEDDNATSYEVTILFPCLNEADAIANCIKDAYSTMLKAHIHGEVLVVDNGSTDNSPSQALSAGARVISETKRGYGMALRAGFKAARGEIIVMIDADNQYDLSSIPLLIDPIVNNQADLVISQRILSPELAIRRRFRGSGTKLLSLLINAIGKGVQIPDSQSGYRAFRRETVLALDLSSTGMEFASEMIICASRAGLRITSVPSTYRTRIGTSKLRPVRDGIRHLKLITKMSYHNPAL